MGHYQFFSRPNFFEELAPRSPIDCSQRDTTTKTDSESDTSSAWEVRDDAKSTTAVKKRVSPLIADGADPLHQVSE